MLQFTQLDFARNVNQRRSVACRTYSAQYLGGNGTTNQSQTIIEKRACDVIVLGDSTLAAACAYSLARRGKKVISIPDMGLTAGATHREGLRPLVLPDPSAHITSMAIEAATFWDGLEMQAGAPLLWRCKSLELAPAPRSLAATTARGMPATSVLGATFGAMAVRCKRGKARVQELGEEGLQGQLPMVRAAQGVRALLQPDGAVINAVAAHDALCALSERSGVLLKDRLRLRAWRDTGSTICVSASTEMQPNAVSVFEAEQVLLAPGQWAPECLEMFGLQLDVQQRTRTSIRCPSADTLTRMPLVRYWSGGDDEEDGLGSALDASWQEEADAAQEQAASRQVSAYSTSSTAGSGSSSSQLILPTSGSSGGPKVRWTCFPLIRSRVKLASSPLDGMQVGSCWEWGARRDAAKSSNAGGSGRKEEDLPSLPLVQARQQAQGWVKGLGVSRKELLESLRPADSPAALSSTAVDVVTKDGLPLLGWHPGFEQGRVLVACTTALWGADSVSDGDEADTTADKKGHGSTADSALAAPAAGPGQDGARPAFAAGGTQFSTPSSTPATRPSKPHVEWGALSGSGVDGYMLMPVLAKAAADILAGVTSLAMGVDAHLLDVNRPAVGVQLVHQGFDTWGRLQALQDGSERARLRKANMSEDELQELDEQESAAKRAVLGAPAKAGSGAVPGRGMKRPEV